MPSIKVRGKTAPQDHDHSVAGEGGALGTDVVDTTQIKDGALSADAAGRAKMADTFVQAAKVDTGAIETVKIADGALSADAAGRAKMANDFLQNAKVATDAAIAKSKLVALEIVNADVNVAAAIVKSKLAALEIADADVAAAADIAQSKLSLAITDSEVAVAADISKDKLAILARAAMYHGDEVEVSVTGTTEEQVKDLAIIIDPTNALDLKTLRIIARLKSTAASQASLAIYHDGGGVADLTLTSVSATYEEKSGTIDCSAWGTGRHTIEIKLVDDTAAETAYNELLEIYGVQ